MIHFFKKPISHLALPEKFTYPFHYTPHPLCVLAAEEVKEYIANRKEWQEELASGKMFGVLIVQTDNGITNNEENQIGYLAAFSGNLVGKNLHPYFVPPVWKREKRSDFLNTKKPNSQDRVSMGWKFWKRNKFEK